VVTTMSIPMGLKSWLWIPKTWIVLYPILLLVGVLTGVYLGPSYYWLATIIGVPVAVIPITYRNLVGGGCSLRFHICALVKGILAGSVFLALSLGADLVIWQFLGTALGWNPLTLDLSGDIYLLWLFSGMAGGLGARIVEVRGQTQPAEITIAGFE